MTSITGNSGCSHCSLARDDHIAYLRQLLVARALEIVRLAQAIELHQQTWLDATDPREWGGRELVFEQLPALTGLATHMVHVAGANERPTLFLETLYELGRRCEPLLHLPKDQFDVEAGENLELLAASLADAAIEAGHLLWLLDGE